MLLWWLDPFADLSLESDSRGRIHLTNDDCSIYWKHVQIIDRKARGECLRNLPLTICAELDLNTIDDALDAIARGECVVVMDDCSRESEGNLVMAAQYTSPEALAFIVRHTTGVVCVAIRRRAGLTHSTYL